MKWIVSQVVEVLKIRASFAGILVRAGAGIIIAITVALVISISIPTKYGSLVFSIFPDGEPPYWLYGVALLLIVCGLIVGFRKELRDERESERRMLLAVELRGLQENSDTPLVDYIPKKAIGRRESLIVDIRKFIDGGVVRDPNSALQRVKLISHDLSERIKSKGRGDI